MTDRLLAFVVFWGVWLLVPMLIDGLATAAHLFGVVAMRLRRRAPVPSLRFHPIVSIIVPVYNSQETLEACLRSIAEQDYPPYQIEVIAVNNGSTDRSFEVFMQLQAELNLSMSWHSIINQGKAWALNAGIHLVKGQYIFNLDSDIVLARDAVRRVVEVMENEPDLGAVTGAVHVIERSPEAPPFLRALAGCEFIEYLTAFHVGREHQTLMQNIYTLSGAFSVFRREVLLQTTLYSQRTVTEDTDLTFELYERFRKHRVGCVSSAVAYTHPTSSLAALYAQRVRWQRGQLEVSAQHKQLMNRPLWQLRGLVPARVLAVDHTLAFPRVVWTFLLPVLFLFGYPPSLIVSSAVGLYLFYLLIELGWTLVAWLGVPAQPRARLVRLAWLLPIMPFYRMVIFWFRFSGFLYAVAEPGKWRVENPAAQIRAGLQDLRREVQQFLRPGSSTPS